jgi:hypothetical protein
MAVQMQGVDEFARPTAVWQEKHPAAVYKWREKVIQYMALLQDTEWHLLFTVLLAITIACARAEKKGG